MKIILPLFIFILSAIIPYQNCIAKEINIGKVFNTGSKEYKNLKEYAPEDVSVIGDAYYENETNLPAEGVIKAFYPNGTIKREERVKKGKLNGNSNIYYPNGKILLKISFQDNKPNGNYKIYHQNGKTKLSGSYADGKKSGVFNKYDERGDIMYAITFNNDRIKSGIKYTKDGAENIPLDELIEIASTFLEWTEP